MRRAVEIRATTSTIEVLHDRRRVASHVRSYRPKGTPVTNPEHRPKSHRDYGDWPPSRVIGWATSIGPNTAKLVEEILASRPHPEQGYRASLALIRNAKRYGRDRMEAACARAIEIGSPSRKSVEMILKRGLDRLTLDDRTGGGAYVRAEGFRHEIFNFRQDDDGKFRGYVRPPGAVPVRDQRINIDRLGGASGDDAIAGVTVFWAAAHPALGGTRIVGWYDEATVNRKWRPSADLTPKADPPILD